MQSDKPRKSFLEQFFLVSDRAEVQCDCRWPANNLMFVPLNPSLIRILHSLSAIFFRAAYLEWSERWIKFGPGLLRQLPCEPVAELWLHHHPTVLAWWHLGWCWDVNMPWVGGPIKYRTISNNAFNKYTEYLIIIRMQTMFVLQFLQSLTWLDWVYWTVSITAGAPVIMNPCKCPYGDGFLERSRPWNGLTRGRREKSQWTSKQK